MRAATPMRQFVCGFRFVLPYFPSRSLPPRHRQLRLVLTEEKDKYPHTNSGLIVSAHDCVNGVEASLAKTLGRGCGQMGSGLRS